MLYRGAETQFVSSEEKLMSRETLTGAIIEHGLPPTPCVSWIGNAEADRRVAWVGDDRRMWFDSWDGSWNVIREFTEPTTAVDSMSFNAAHRVMLFAVRPNTPDAAFLVDDVTGESVGDEITAKGDFVDRTRGPTGGSTDIPSTSFAKLRPDGRLFAANAAQTGFETLVLGTSVLTDTIIELDGTSHVAFQARDAAGLVLSIQNARFGVEQIDLSTGDRQEPPPLVMPEGGEFNTVHAEVEENGLLAISADGAVARWESGVLVEQITTGPERANKYSGHTSGEGRLVVSVELPDGSFEVHYINTNPGELNILATVTGPMAGAYATRDEFAILGTDGMLRTYDQTGAIVRQLDTGLTNDLSGWDQAVSDSGGLVAFGGSAGVIILDPATEQLTRVPTFGPVSSLLFARGEALLLIGDHDGVVRLWDVREGVSRGVLMRTGERIVNSGWYDEETDSLWVGRGTRLLKLPLNPVDFLERACEILNRDLTQAEWDRYIELGGQVQSACG